MSETELQVPEVELPRERRSLAGKVFRRPLGSACVALLVTLILGCAAAPFVAPYSPMEQDLTNVFSGPSAQHLLGTDQLGRDVLSRLLFGGRISFVGVAYAVVVLLVAGIPVGLVSGYLGGRIDSAVRWITDIMLSIPSIIALLVVVSMFGDNQAAAMITLGVLGAPSLIRIVRASTIAVRSDLYVTAARVAGLSTAQVLRRHILPRVTGPIIVKTSLFAGAALLAESGLAFLGLGVQEPRPTWGGMIQAGSTYMSQYPWLIVPPGLVIALTALALGLLGDVMRDSRGAAAPTRSARRRPEEARVSRDPGAVQDAERAHRAISPEEGALLSIRGLTVAFQTGSGEELTVVDDVSFDLQAGETLGLVGESGCGKSVTGRALLGVLPRTGRVLAGECWFDGDDLLTAPPRKRRSICGNDIALVSQDAIASLDPNFTVGSQLAEVIRRHTKLGRRAARQRAIELLELVRLPEPATVAVKYPHQLSGGMAQRVCIAAALAGKPRVLIADEPTTALDVTVQAEILDLLRELQGATAMSIILVTHDWGVVADMCDRAVVMYAGEVVETSPITRVFAHPMHPYTAGLLESNPHGTVRGKPLPTVSGTVPAPGTWPQGCHFSPRCPLAAEACRLGPISLQQPEPGRLTRCIRFEHLNPSASPAEPVAKARGSWTSTAQSSARPLPAETDA